MLGIWIFVVLGAALFEIKPALREISFWRARRYATKAEVDLSAENWPAAQVKATLAYQIQPEEPTAIRAVARLQSLTGNAQSALAFWDILKKTKAFTAKDRRMQVEDLLRSDMLPQARKEVEALLADAPNDPQNLRVAAKWAAAEKNTDQALKFAEKAQAVDPDNSQGRLLLGLLQSETPKMGAREAGVETLLQVVKNRDRSALEALVFLSTRKDLSDATRAIVIENLRAHPLASEQHRLLALDLEIAAIPDKREAILDAACEQYKQADPIAQRAFGVWLNGRREFARTLDLIPVAEAMKRKDFLLVTLDAMAQQKRWTEIEEVLQGKAVPLDEVYTELFLARSSMELGRASAADLHWRRAQVAAAASPEQMRFLGGYAERIGQTDQAEYAYRSLLNNASSARNAYESLLRIAEKRRDVDTVRDLLAGMVKRWPQDNSVRNDFTYFNLLRGDDLEASLKTARELVTAAPSSLAHRSTLALAQIRLNHPAEALAVYDNLNVPWDRAPASHRAVYAAALGLAGKTAQARALAGSDSRRRPSAGRTHAHFPMASPVTYAGVLVADRKSGDTQPWPTLLAVLGLWVLNINQLHVEWSVNPQYTYGWTVPFLALYLFAERWKNRPATEPVRFQPLIVAFLVLLGLALFPLRLIEEAAPDWRTANWAMATSSALVTLAAIYYSGGPRWLIHFAFPVCFVLIAVPWPVPLEKILIQKLMTIVSAVCVEALSFFSIPAVQQGNIIVIATGKVGVEEACSGVRSLQTTLMAALFLGELFRFGFIRRILLLLAGLGIAFLCNLGRSFALVWISAHDGTAAAMKWHDSIGVGVLVASLAGLALLCALLRPRGAAAAEQPEAPDAEPWRPRFAARWVLFAAMAWLGVLEVGTELWYRSHEKGGTVPPWTVRWPTHAQGFRDIPLGEATRAMLRYDEGRSVAWSEPNGYHWSMIFLRWAPGRSSKQLARSHGPEVCLAAAGAVLREDLGVNAMPAGGHELPVHSYLFTVRETPLFVGYCLWEDYAPADGPQSTRVDMTMETRMRDVLNGRRNNGQQVIEVAVFGPRSAEEASAAVAGMLATVIKP